MQEPATPLVIRHGPFEQDLRYGRRRLDGYPVIHEFGPAPTELSIVVHASSTSSVAIHGAAAAAPSGPTDASRAFRRLRSRPGAPYHEPAERPKEPLDP